MSKNVQELLEKADSGALDEDDARYLLERGLLPEGWEPPESDLASRGWDLEEILNTGDANTVGLTREKLEQLLEQVRAKEEADNAASDKGFGPIASEREADQYDEMDDDQLTSELESRDLPTTGSVQKKRARLRKADRS